MGVDLRTYRARIGTFSACTAPKSFRHVQSRVQLTTISALCPRPSLLLALTCLTLLLLCAGDVEANPGPRNEDVVTLIKECHDETTRSLNDIKQHLVALKTRVTAIEKTLNSVAKFKDNFDAVTESVNEVKSNISKTSGQLVEVVDDINNRMRRNNLIIKGLPEGDHEGYTETEQVVRDLFANHLKITAGDIERAHRFGQRRPGFQRPIIVKFLNFKSKMDALRNSYKLKNLETPKVWLEEDFSPSVQFARKKLRDFARSNRTDNARFSVRFNKLHLQGKVYQFDPASGSVVQASADHERSTK